MNRSATALPMQRSILIPVRRRRVREIRRAGSSAQELPAHPTPGQQRIRSYTGKPIRAAALQTHAQERERGGGTLTFVRLHEPDESRPDSSESILNSEPLGCCSNTNIGLLKGLRRAICSWRISICDFWHPRLRQSPRRHLDDGCTPQVARKDYWHLHAFRRNHPYASET